MDTARKRNSHACSASPPLDTEALGGGPHGHGQEEEFPRLLSLPAPRYGSPGRGPTWTRPGRGIPTLAQPPRPSLRKPWEGAHMDTARKGNSHACSASPPLATEALGGGPHGHRQ